MKIHVLELAAVLGSMLVYVVFSSNAAPPGISSQPQSQTVILYQEVVFEVIASGSAPLAYQWLKQGVSIPNATNSQLVLPQANFAHAGKYAARISNAEGSLISTSAVLTVYLPKPGDLDYSFDCRGLTDGDIWTLALQQDGKVLIGGGFSHLKGFERGKIARLNGDGSIDISFVATLPATNAVVISVVTQNDGKILVGGYFDTINGVNYRNLARLNQDGTLDITFQSGTLGPDGGVTSIVVQSDGKVVIGGGFSRVNGTPRYHIARLNANGSVDSGFQSPLSDGGVQSMALQSDGKLVIGGNFNTIAGTNIARLNSDGSLDTNFQHGLSGTDRHLTSIAVQKDGKVLIGGKFSTINDVNRNNFARLNTDGTLDTSFQTVLSGVTGSVFVALQPDGKALVGGGFTSVNGVPRNRIARLDTNGTLDTTFESGATGSSTAWVHCFAVDSDQRILFAGPFTAVNGVPVGGVARVWGKQPSAIENITRSSGGNVTLGLRLAEGTNRVQYKTNLNDTAWIDLSGDVSASASDFSTNKLDASVGSAPQRFYRLKQLP